jgi:antitoxin (DNA-binding transcriptional repressor) of toxin-antitoxin stability system
MLVISTREFREKQGMYLGKVKSGVDILLKSRGNGSFKIVPVKEDDTLMSKEDFFAKIDRALEQARQGKGRVFNSSKELREYYDSL